MRIFVTLLYFRTQPLFFVPLFSGGRRKNEEIEVVCQMRNEGDLYLVGLFLALFFSPCLKRDVSASVWKYYPAFILQ